MIKINNNNNWIDESEVKNIGKMERTEYDTKNKSYIICVNGNYGLYFEIPFETQFLRDKEFDILGELLSKLNKDSKGIEDKNGYIDGFKDGTEYALKLQKVKGEE